MNIFKKLEEINLPLGEYAVVGSGILAALNLREANDLDVIISSKLLDKMKDGNRYKKEIRCGKLFLIGDDIDIITQLSLDDYPTTIDEAIKSAIIINGFQFLNIEETIKFKQALGREKDFKDIELLNNYLANKERMA